MSKQTHFQGESNSMEANLLFYFLQLQRLTRRLSQNPNSSIPLYVNFSISRYSITDFKLCFTDNISVFEYANLSELYLTVISSFHCIGTRSTSSFEETIYLFP